MINEKGFTLLEMMVALSIFMILLSLSFLVFKPQMEMVKGNTFFTQLQADLFYAQSYALSHQMRMYVQFTPSKKEYAIKGDIATGEIIYRKYDETIVINEDRVSFNFSILPNGNMSKFATYPFSIDEKKYTLTIQIGQGRFYVTKW
ncbi:competence type IV pilus minor pilin ComGD [Niallia nealsonii]|uniref:Competence protein ComG n=1 Tax=Niallia nealsonii TaxID=115979 RepID=A0A2N0Z882_9BACI|nr:competence type IV pilus minor pilin ComGD [Niallia nealsonii]PKG25712.1 competence protein ComG [Niallia nealsonii]